MNYFLLFIILYSISNMNSFSYFMSNKIRINNFIVTKSALKDENDKIKSSIKNITLAENFRNFMKIKEIPKVEDATGANGYL